MSSIQKNTKIQRFELCASKCLLIFEIGLHIGAGIAVLALPNDGFKLVLLVLHGLLAWRYFHRISVIQRVPAGSYLEFDVASAIIIWSDCTTVHEFHIKAENLRLTRWFILLKLDRGHHLHGLLLADSFVDRKQYSNFRKLLGTIE